MSLLTVRKDSVWLRVRYQRDRLPRHVLSPQPHEYDGRLLRLRGQRPGILPPPYDPPLQLRSALLFTVSTTHRSQVHEILTQRDKNTNYVAALTSWIHLVYLNATT